MSLLRPSLSATVTVGILSGLVASWVKAQVEAPMQQMGESWWPPEPGQKDLVGADPGGHPERMPPAVIARSWWHRFTGGELDDQTAVQVQTVIHYGFGAGAGALYALVVRHFPGAARGLGAPAGAVLYGLTHGSLIPVAGVQPPPTRMPRASLFWEGGSHVVFGVATELTRAMLSIPIR